MKIKVALFGRSELVDRFQEYAKDHNEIETIPFIYCKASEARELVEKAFMCDVYLFLECLPYLYAQDKIKKKRLPTIQVAFDEYMILTSFYHMKNKYQQQLSRLSIDVQDEIHVSEVLRELNLTDDDIYTYSYKQDAKVDIKKIVDYHKQLFEEGKIDYVLTSLHEIEKQLNEYCVPTYLMVVP